MTAHGTAAERVAAGEVVWTGRYDGRSQLVYDLETPCGCRWTPNGVAIMRPSDACLSSALRAEALRLEEYRRQDEAARLARSAS